MLADELAKLPEEPMAQTGPFPISHKRYKHRYWRRFTSYEHLRSLQECSVVSDEILPCAASFPIAFRRSKAGIEPVALLSLEPDAPTPFVSESGKWLAPYVPSILRCPPFLAAPVHGQSLSDPAQLELLVDEATGLVTDDPVDEPFFTPQGALTPQINSVRSFFKYRAVSALRTQAQCAVLEKLNLFDPLPSQDGVVQPRDLIGINPGRVSSLSVSQVGLLMKSGAMQLIYAHQVSLMHCKWLRQAQSSEHSPRKEQMKDSISEFLNAVAQSQDSFQIVTGPEEAAAYAIG